ncbi:MAG: CoA-binding protein [Candidatus Dojkabacteria bacterium]
MIDKNLTYAVIGASFNPEKYGHRVFKDLLEAGYKVIPINPKKGILLEQQVYATVSEYADIIDVAVFVVPPEITLQVLEEVYAKGIKRVWMQPGSESEKAKARCQELGIEFVAEACIMVQRRVKK